MKVKKTLAELKNLVKRETNNTGLVLDTNAPYWVNSDQIQYMKDVIDNIIAGGYNIEITGKQESSLIKWIDSLKSKYLFG